MDTGECLRNAIEAHQKGHWAKARSLCLKVLEHHPEEPNALHILGIMAMQNGFFAEAKRYLQKAVERYPSIAIFHTNLANAYQLAGEFVNAADHYQQALSLDPTHLDTLNNYANTLRQLGRHTEALDLYQRILYNQPDFYEAALNMGNTYRELAQYYDAISAYQLALNVKPHYALAYNNLGHSYYLNQQISEAKSAFKKALQLDPNEVDAHNNLANVCFFEGEFSDALSHYLKALTLSPDHPQALGGLVTLLKQFRPQTYLPTLETALVHLLCHERVQPQDLALVAIEQLQLKYRQAFNQASSLVDLNDISDFLNNALLLSTLKLTFNVSARFELFLVDLRANILNHCHQYSRIPKSIFNFTQALAHQCYNNEYIFFASDTEQKRVEALALELEKCSPETSNFTDTLILVSLYRPLHHLAFTEKWLETPLEQWPSACQSILQLTLFDYYQEQNLKASIETLSDSETPDSKAVQSQYEENPYPRWFKIAKPQRIAFAALQKQFANIDLPSLPGDMVKILVAGCGTGKHPIRSALSYQNADVIGLDLSKSSLAYAKRMAHQLGVDNVTFVQADILNLKSLDKTFDLIESVGVLHHMRYPLDGWRALVAKLKPKGLMRLGLYSQAGRRIAYQAKKRIQKESLPSSREAIVAFRKALLDERPIDLEPLFYVRDFYAFSECRDFLFHTYERPLNIDFIKTAMKQLKLRFLGFELDDLSVRQAYLERFPRDPLMRSLDNWQLFETDRPDTFKEMYRFWCQKE